MPTMDPLPLPNVCVHCPSVREITVEIKIIVKIIVEIIVEIKNLLKS